MTGSRSSDPRGFPPATPPVPGDSGTAADWVAARKLAYRMVDDMFSAMETIRDSRAWSPVPDHVKASLREAVPYQAADLAAVYEQFKRDILPYPTGNPHPRFWGWVMANGSVAGCLADFLTSAMNCHVAGYDQAALYVEQQVIEWLRILMDFPPSSGGLLVSGGTVANLTGLAVARQARAGFDVKTKGLGAPGAPRLTVYGSIETHNWIYKACELLGLGREAFRKIDVDSQRRIRLDDCRAAIEADLKTGHRPFCLIGNAGTVNTAAIDDLDGLRSLADEYDLWFHIDGAFGSLAALSGSRALVSGQEKADSLAFDLHKWGYMPYEIGVVLVRDKDVHRATFAPPPSSAPLYLSSADAGISVDTTYFADLGIQLSRDFKALKAWMSLKNQGVDRIGRIIDQNIAQIKYLEQRVLAEERLQLLAPVSLNIVCFRYHTPSLSSEELDRLNQDILVKVQLSGIAVPSHTWLDGQFAIRVCNTNHRSRRSDFDMLVDAVLRLGAEMAA